MDGFVMFLIGVAESIAWLILIALAIGLAHHR